MARCLVGVHCVLKVTGPGGELDPVGTVGKVVGEVLVECETSGSGDFDTALAVAIRLADEGVDELIAIAGIDLLDDVVLSIVRKGTGWSECDIGRAVDILKRVDSVKRDDVWHEEAGSDQRDAAYASFDGLSNLLVIWAWPLCVVALVTCHGQ